MSSTFFHEKVSFRIETKRQLLVRSIFFLLGRLERPVDYPFGYILVVDECVALESNGYPITTASQMGQLHSQFKGRTILIT